MNLPPEIEEGNIEYKLHLSNPTPDRFNHLVSQMKWRLTEGFGEAIYDIGVTDKGILVGLEKEELEASLETLKRMAFTLGADISINREQTVESPDNIPRKVAEVLVRNGIDNETHFLEIRLAIIGGADAGKSTFLGTLTTGELDNGRGKSRLNLLRHRHEIESGRTSSISRQIIGFNSKGAVVNFATNHVTKWSDICQLSSKIITFMDTCGHPKFQKTTVSGLTGRAPDYVCLIINGNAAGISQISQEHLTLALLLKVPLSIVISKIDITSIEQLTKTIQVLFKSLKAPGVKLLPVIMENEDDITVAIPNFISSSIVPIFLISNVTGENLDLFYKFLNLLPKSIKNFEKLIDNDVEYHIEEVYQVPDTGIVVDGLLVSGKITRPKDGEKHTYFIGPDCGRFVPIYIESIHRQRCNVSHIKAGQAGTCSISFIDAGRLKKKRKRFPSPSEQDTFRIRRGQVILRKLPEPSLDFGVVSDFTVEIDILFGTLSDGMQVKLFTGSISEMVLVCDLEKDVRVGEREVVRLRFLSEPQWIHTSWTILIRHAHIKCVGKRHIHIREGNRE